MSGDIRNMREAEDALQDAIADCEADMGEGASDACWHDLVVATAFGIESDALAREFCRTQLGSIPYDLEARLGRKDWLES